MIKFAGCSLFILLSLLTTVSKAGECHWTRRYGTDPYPTPHAACTTYETAVSQYLRQPVTFKTLRLTRSSPITVYQCVFNAQGYSEGFYGWEYETSRSDKTSRDCDPCALRFSNPGNNSSLSNENVKLFGYAISKNPTDNGYVAIAVNGKTIFEYSGLFQEASNQLQSGVSTTLRPGINTLSLSGSTATCNVSDSMILYVDPQANLAANKGGPKSCPSSFFGNPISSAIGNKYQYEEDYSIKGAPPLVFSRQYNSVDGYWRHNFSTRLAISGSFLILIHSDGRESRFTRNGQVATPSPAELGQLVWSGSNWVYKSPTGEQFQFDSFGRLTQKIAASGLLQQLTYSGNPGALAVTVTDSVGNSLQFTQDRHYQPLDLSAPGLRAQYFYDSTARLQSVAKTQAGQTLEREYHYEDVRYPRFLTGITDERGIRFATWTYDDLGRAVSSEHSDGMDKVSVLYDTDGTATITNELGKVTKYSFQTIHGIKHITSIQGEPSANCPNGNSSFTYDTRGLLKTKTDNKGILTTYTYNTRGLEVSRTEASGTPQARTITTDWHPTLFLPTVVTEPNQITRYQYDDQGRQLSRTVESTN